MKLNIYIYIKVSNVFFSYDVTENDKNVRKMISYAIIRILKIYKNVKPKLIHDPVNLESQPH